MNRYACLSTVEFFPFLEARSKVMLVLFFLAGLSLGTLSAQPILDQDYFPLPGDTLNLAVDGLPETIEPGAPGADQTWDFRSLQAPFIIRQPVLAPEEGLGVDSFPDADQLVRLEDGVEAYYDLEDDAYRLLGFFGADPADLDIEATLLLDQPLPERHAPLRYLDKREVETSVFAAIAVDDLPDEVVDELPIQPDSLRLRGVLARTDEVDAWGTLHIPGGSYEVLREKRTEERDFRLEAKINPLPWQDVSILVPDEGFLGEVRTVNYFFWSQEAKEPIAQVEMDPTESFPVEVTYKALDFSTATRRVAADKPDVYAYPNPAIVDVRFAFSSLPAGHYTLTLFNMLGVEQWSRTYFIEGEHTERVNIAGLSKGSYLYSLSDEQGRTLITKRLIVIKP